MKSFTINKNYVIKSINISVIALIISWYFFPQKSITHDNFSHHNSMEALPIKNIKKIVPMNKPVGIPSVSAHNLYENNQPNFNKDDFIVYEKREKNRETALEIESDIPAEYVAQESLEKVTTAKQVYREAIIDEVNPSINNRVTTTFVDSDYFDNLTNDYTITNTVAILPKYIINDHLHVKNERVFSMPIVKLDTQIDLKNNNHKNIDEIKPIEPVDEEPLDPDGEEKSPDKVEPAKVDEKEQVNKDPVEKRSGDEKSPDKAEPAKGDDKAEDFEQKNANPEADGDEPEEAGNDEKGCDNTLKNDTNDEETANTAATLESKPHGIEIAVNKEKEDDTPNKSGFVGLQYSDEMSLEERIKRMEGQLKPSDNDSQTARQNSEGENNCHDASPQADELDEIMLFDPSEITLSEPEPYTDRREAPQEQIPSYKDTLTKLLQGNIINLIRRANLQLEKLQNEIHIVMDSTSKKRIDLVGREKKLTTRWRELDIEIQKQRNADEANIHEHQQAYDEFKKRQELRETQMTSVSLKKSNLETQLKSLSKKIATAEEVAQSNKGKPDLKKMEKTCNANALVGHAELSSKESNDLLDDIIAAHGQTAAGLRTLTILRRQQEKLFNRLEMEMKDQQSDPAAAPKQLNNNEKRMQEIVQQQAILNKEWIDLEVAEKKAIKEKQKLEDREIYLKKRILNLSKLEPSKIAESLLNSSVKLDDFKEREKYIESLLCDADDVPNTDTEKSFLIN